MSTRIVLRLLPRESPSLGAALVLCPKILTNTNDRFKYVFLVKVPITGTFIDYRCQYWYKFSYVYRYQYWYRKPVVLVPVLKSKHEYIHHNDIARFLLQSKRFVPVPLSIPVVFGTGYRLLMPIPDLSVSALIILCTVISRDGCDDYDLVDNNTLPEASAVHFSSLSCQWIWYRLALWRPPSRCPVLLAGNCQVSLGCSWQRWNPIV